MNEKRRNLVIAGIATAVFVALIWLHLFVGECNIGERACQLNATLVVNEESSDVSGQAATLTLHLRATSPMLVRLNDDQLCGLRISAGSSVGKSSVRTCHGGWWPDSSELPASFQGDEKRRINYSFSRSSWHLISDAYETVYHIPVTLSVVDGGLWRLQFAGDVYFDVTTLSQLSVSLSPKYPLMSSRESRFHAKISLDLPESKS